MNFQNIKRIIDEEIYKKHLLEKECERLNIPVDFILAIVPHHRTFSRLVYVNNQLKTIIYICSSTDSGVKNDFRHEMRHAKDYYNGIIDNSSELSAYLYPYKRSLEDFFIRLRNDFTKLIKGNPN